MRKLSDGELLCHLRERLRYDSSTGTFYRRAGFQGVVAGAKVGTRNSSGRLQGMFLKKRYQVDHLVWLWETGSLPASALRHINGDQDDSRFCNLALSEEVVLVRELDPEKTTEFIAEAKGLFGESHDYANSVYVNARTKVEIACLKHGVFHRKPREYLRSPKGCPVCCHEHAAEKSRKTPEEKRATARTYVDKNRELYREAKRRYAKSNPDVYKKHAKLARSKPWYKAQHSCRWQLRRVLLATKGIKNASTQELLGYSVAEFKAHIEAQFEPWMTWENHGEWHIDHITPVTVYIRNGVMDPKIINALENMRPLEAKENMRRGIPSDQY